MKHLGLVWADVAVCSRCVPIAEDEADMPTEQIKDETWDESS